MTDREIGSFRFKDREEGDGYALVKASKTYPGSVTVVLSLSVDGDIQVIMDLTDAERLADLITRGVQAARAESNR
jgi:hypothetical protein